MNTRRVRALRFILALACVLVGPAPTRADDQDTTRREEVHNTAAAFVEAFKAGDAKAVAAFWAEDGDYTDLSGRTISGRAAIADDFAHLFAENKGLTLRIEVGSVRFPTADTAVESGVTSVLSPDGGLPNRACYTNLLVKTGGKWLLSSVRESPYVPPNNYEHLRPLEWLIGEWAQDVKEGHAARVMFEWTPDLNYMIASRAVVVGGVPLDNGSQRIGWDPASKLIRSWSFETDGSFGQGAWTQNGDTWVNTVSSVLRAGSLMTSTTVVTRTGPDTLTFQTKDQQMDGKPVPDSPVITMVRVVAP